jgi:hypothetical protein
LLRGQGDNVLHEIAVQAATTPEILIAEGAIALTPAVVVYYHQSKK